MPTDNTHDFLDRRDTTEKRAGTRAVTLFTRRRNSADSWHQGKTKIKTDRVRRGQRERLLLTTTTYDAHVRTFELMKIAKRNPVSPIIDANRRATRLTNDKTADRAFCLTNDTFRQRLSERRRSTRLRWRFDGSGEDDGQRARCSSRWATSHARLQTKTQENEQTKARIALTFQSTLLSASSTLACIMPVWQRWMSWVTRSSQCALMYRRRYCCRPSLLFNFDIKRRTKQAHGKTHAARSLSTRAARCQSVVDVICRDKQEKFDMFFSKFVFDFAFSIWFVKYSRILF